MQDFTDDRALTAQAAATSPAFRYWAFISYSRHDSDAASKLHRFLETYRVPRALVGRVIGGRTIPRRLIPIFRDRDELAGASDLPGTLHEALGASASLIVICSPNGAVSKWVDQEVRDFKLMGRGARIFPLVIAGEPNASDNPDADLPECFPKSLRFDVAADGAITDRRSEPLAADARPGMDGWKYACLKLVAGILGVGFDDLRRREHGRQQRRRLIGAAAGVVMGIATACGYVALADAELAVPAGDAVRARLDQYGWTLFRPVMSHEDMQRAAGEARARLRPRLLRTAGSGLLTEHPPSGWTIGQIAGALLRDPDTASDDLKGLFGAFDALFRAGGPDEPEGYLLLENTDGGAVIGRAESAIWTIMAISNAMDRPALLADGRKEKLDHYLAVAQRIAQRYAPLPDGGWNTALNQVDPEKHSIYTSGMALHMLLELRKAGLGWIGSRERLDRMIADTSGWLIRAFDSRGSRSGWRRSLDDDKLPDSGITLLIFSALGRACADAGVTISEAVREAALASQVELRRRGYDTADPDIRYDVRVRDQAGSVSTRVTITRVIWYPWAVEGLSHWKRCALSHGLPPATVRAIDRSLGHLLSKVAANMLNEITSEETLPWVLAETAYGLGRVP